MYSMKYEGWSMKYIISIHLFKYKPFHFLYMSYNNFQAHVSQIQEWTQINAHGHSKVICLICKSKVFHVVLNSPLNLTTLRSLILFCFWVKFFEIRLSKLRHSQILNYEMSVGLICYIKTTLWLYEVQQLKQWVSEDLMLS